MQHLRAMNAPSQMTRGNPHLVVHCCQIGRSSLILRRVRFASESQVLYEVQTDSISMICCNLEEWRGKERNQSEDSIPPIAAKTVLVEILQYYRGKGLTSNVGPRSSIFDSETSTLQQSGFHSKHVWEIEKASNTAGWLEAGKFDGYQNVMKFLYIRITLGLCLVI